MKSAREELMECHYDICTELRDNAILASILGSLVPVDDKADIDKYFHGNRKKKLVKKTLRKI